MSELFLKLLNMSITASWLALAVIVLRLLLKKAPKAIVCVMWALVGVRLVCPFSIESVLSLIPSAETVPQEIVYSPAPTIHTGIATFNTMVNPIISEQLAPKVGASVNPMQVITFAASVIWIVGMAAMVLYTAVSYLRLYFKVREAVKCGDVWLCDNISTPFILGIIRPRIYIPSSMNEVDIEYVAAHEKAHIKRLDYIWKPLGFALLTVYWFNPVMWVAYVLLCRDIELACDEKVIKENGTEIKKPYSDALINCSVPRKMISVCPLAFGEVGVKGRVKNILSYKKPAFWIIIVAIVACAAVAVCFLTDPKEDEKVTFSGIPLTFAADDCYVFYPQESVYDCAVFSSVQSADAAPDYRLHGDMTFEELTSETINVLGTMSEVTLTEKNFDTTFDAYGKDTAAALRKNNRRAWELHQKVGENNMWYTVLEQKDGTYYVGVGYYEHLDDGSDLMRWVYRVNKQNQTYIEEIDEFGGYNVYKFYDSVDPVAPSIFLYDDPQTFSFTYSAFSSYFAVGTYELTDDTLTLKTNDGMNTYVFDVADNTFVFDASRSSKIPEYRYSGDSMEPECPVPDGAVFEFESRMNKYTGVEDTAHYDIDNDGKNEILVLCAGPTSGVVTFTFSVVDDNGEEYTEMFFGGDWRDYGFEESDDGTVRFYYIERENGSKSSCNIGFENGHIVRDGPWHLEK
ncbi:MAG: hypothetical protein IJ002_01060 [Clostridia bacterium]|nr:hypothetical protein [Clostridia bacterium]